MSGRLLSLFVWIFAICMLSPTAQAAPIGRSDANLAPTACSALEQDNFAGVPDAPAQITEADARIADASLPAHCYVQGYIAPNIAFELRLPRKWNGKLLEVGCGGYCGTTRAPAAIGWCKDGLSRGYACIVTNQGHNSTADGSYRRGTGDAVWAYNNLQAEIDYGFRAAHAAAVLGKAITARFYGNDPSHAYFMGCSGGGRQALVEAQRFPADFDGIIAIDPSNLMCTGVTLLWNALALQSENGEPLLSDADINLLHEAVLAKCDANDGLKDGLITDPRSCRFDPKMLACKNANKSDCLTAAQITAVRKIYDGPRTSNGNRLFPGGAMLGSEQGSMFRSDLRYKEEFWRYMGFMPDPGPNWKAKDFDFDRDSNRLGLMGSIYASDNPDLRRFKARGGKLLIAQGWDDSGSPLPMNTIDYYETVTRTMGGHEATQDFARLFMMPGVAHCVGGPGAGAVDYLGYLETWVEQGHAPDMLVGYHVDSKDWADYAHVPADPTATFSRPYYPYPLISRYKGAGDPKDYSSFEAIRVSQ